MGSSGSNNRLVDGIRAIGVQPPPVRLHPLTARRGWRWLLAGLAFGVLVLALVATPTRISFVRTIAALWRPGTYLVLFENDAELRPTGGFIGSYATVTVAPDGAIDYDVETNVYKRDLEFSAAHPIPPPAPLAGITDQWALRDSNWEIDARDALETVSWFYEQETGKHVDGVVAITARSVQALLRRIGPLKLADGSLLAADSFYDTLHRTIEKEYFYTDEHRLENEPKQVLADLAPQLVRRAQRPWGLVRTLDWVQAMLGQKQILVWFADDRSTVVEAKQWAGRIDATAQQLLVLNSANIGGMKSSLHMQQRVKLAIQTGDPSTYDLTVVRQHTGTGAWPDHRNDNLVRIVVPAGAAVQTATLDGAAIEPVVSETTNGRAVVGYRVDTDPGTERTLSVKLSVPVDPALEPVFVWQRQPGTPPDDLTVSIDGQVVIDGVVNEDQRVEL